MAKRGHKKFDDYLNEELKDPEKAAAFIESALEDKDFDALPEVLIRVAKAHGISRLSEESGLAREHIYQALAKGANPTIRTLHDLLDAMNLEITISPKHAV